MKQFSKSGFTLVEMMVAIGIGSVLIYILTSTMSKGYKDSAKIQSISEASDIKNEIDVKFRSAANLCLANLAGQTITLNTAQTSLRNQNTLFTDMNNLVAANTFSFPATYHLDLQNRYNLAAPKVPAGASATVGCLDSICSGVKYQKIRIEDVKYQYLQTVGTNSYLIKLLLEMRQSDGSITQRSQEFIVDAYNQGGVLRIVDCRANSAASFAYQICDPNNSTDCMSWDDIKKLKELLKPLINDKHNVLGCIAFGGTPYPAGAPSFCQFNVGGCPAGWTQYNNWMETTSNTYGGCSGACTTGSHLFADLGRESCGYESKNGWGNCSKHHTGYASITKVGCY